MIRSIARIGSAMLIVIFTASIARAASGTWTNPSSGGVWSDPTNWQNGVIADGQGNNANFGQVGIASGITVHLDSPRTIGQMFFEQSVGNWAIDNNGNSANILTLSVASGTQPMLAIEGSNTATATINVVMAGTQGISLDGLGGTSTLILNGNNTFTGGVQINSAIVQLGNPGALNSTTPNAIQFVAGASPTLRLGGNSIAISGVSGSGNSRIENDSSTPVTLTITGNGQTINYSGVLQDGAGGGALSLVMASNGSLSMSGNNTFSGSLTVNSGQLTLGGSNAFTGGVTINNGQLSLSGPNTFTGGVAINNSGQLILTGTGALNSAAPNAITFGPGSSGKLSVSGPGATASGLSTDASTVGSPAIGGSGTLTINNASDDTYAGVVQDSLSLVKNGSGTLVLSGANSSKGGITINGGTVLLTGSNSYSGSSTINQGTIQAGAANTLSSLSSVTVAAGALLNLGGFSQIIGGLSGAGTVTTTGTNGVDTITVNSGGSFSGTISDALSGRALSLHIIGSQQLSLSGANTFTGSVVNDGGLVLQGGLLSADVLNHASFFYISGTFNGRLLNTGTATVGNISVFAPGNGIENDGSISLVAGQAIAANGPGIINNGTLILNGGTLNASKIVGPGTLIFNTGTLGFTGGDSSISSAIVTTTTNSIINISASNVTIGDGTSLTGFVHQGFLNVGANSNLTLNSAGIAKLGILTSLAGGTINAPNGLTLDAGSSLTGSGTVNAEVSAVAGSVIQATGNLALGAAASPAGFHGDGKLLVGTATVTVNDSNQARLGTLVTLGSGSSPGMLNVANGALVDFDQAITGTGTINSTNSLAQAIINNGLIAGSSSNQKITLTGYVKGDGALQNVTIAGTYSPGLSPAIVQTANLSLAPTNTLIAELGGTTPGSGFDQIKDSATLTLGGTLQVVLAGGFTPSAGNRFEILDWGTLAGKFSSLQLPSLVAPFGWDTTQLYTTGTLSVTASVRGDFNRDGQVTAADIPAMLVALTDLNGYQTTSKLSDDDLLAIGDLDGDGKVTNADLNSLIALLRTGGGSVAAVPEPESIALMALAIPLLLRMIKSTPRSGFPVFSDDRWS